jgi:hypothetical protein
VSTAENTRRALATTSYMPPGLCLRAVSQWLGWPTVQPGYRVDTAVSALYDTRVNGQLRTDGTPPEGVVVYGVGPLRDHIMYSLGGGYARSTDAPSYGVVSTVNIQKFLDKIGYRYAGWSPYLFGTKIADVSTTPAGGGATPIISINQEDEDDMKWLAQDAATKSKGPIFIVDGWTHTKRQLAPAVRQVQNSAEAQGGEKHPVAQVSKAVLDAMTTV